MNVITISVTTNQKSWTENIKPENGVEMIIPQLQESYNI